MTLIYPRLPKLSTKEVPNGTLEIPDIELSLNSELLVLKDVRDTVIKYARLIILSSNLSRDEHPSITDKACTYKSEPRQSGYQGEHIKIKSPKIDGVFDTLEISLNSKANHGTVSTPRFRVPLFENKEPLLAAHF